MEYRTLGRTGLKISSIGVGTWQFGGEWGKAYTPDSVKAILGRAEELGINFLDTAECYGPDHLSESLIGRALGKDRERWIIATKFGHHYTGHLGREDRFSPADALAQLDASLLALRTDYVDLLQFHSGPDADFHREELWTALAAQVKAGKVRHLGISISSRGENLGQVEAAPGYGLGAVQLVYNRLDRGPEERVIPACARLGLGVLARVPLASGYLTGKYPSGKYRSGDRFPSGDVRASHDPDKTAARLEEVETIGRQEVPPGMDMAEWALRWCLRNTAVTAVIPGCKDPGQVERNAAAGRQE